MSLTDPITEGLAAFRNSPPPKIGRVESVDEAAKAARDFEAFFLSQVISTMFAGIKSDGYFGGGPGENIFRSLMFREYGKIIARAGGVGIADAVQREILRQQDIEEPKQ